MLGGGVIGSRGSVQEMRETTATADPGLFRDSPTPIPAGLLKVGATGGAVDGPAIVAVVPLVQRRGLEPVGRAQPQANFTLLDDHQAMNNTWFQGPRQAKRCATASFRLFSRWDMLELVQPGLNDAAWAQW